MSPPQDTFRFLDLANELRCLVYDKLLRDGTRFIDLGRPYDPTPWYLKRTTLHDHGILLVNRQVHREYHKAVFETETIRFTPTSYDSWAWFLAEETHLLWLVRKCEMHLDVGAILKNLKEDRKGDGAEGHSLFVKEIATAVLQMQALQDLTLYWNEEGRRSGDDGGGGGDKSRVSDVRMLMEVCHVIHLINRELPELNHLRVVKIETNGSAGKVRYEARNTKDGLVWGDTGKPEYSGRLSVENASLSPIWLGLETSSDEE
ncbi:hypothetical protein LTS18_012045 [Coniosporium uncinatum]|uniref:Uncharacterized protein n=1 Tax=Coniosporium uncinatum TaxID=93489 RepID=A0ACC3DVS2_9PEZI|nr:hypothetical protein LTS18_012045 [Coniosporium uncinatum]